MKSSPSGKKKELFTSYYFSFMPINPPTQLLVNFQDNGFVLSDKRKSMALKTTKGHRV